MWTTFVVLVLIFVIGCRKRDGFWSTNEGGGIQQAWPAPMQQQSYAQYNVPVQNPTQQGWQQPIYQRP